MRRSSQIEILQKFFNRIYLWLDFSQFDSLTRTDILLPSSREMYLCICVFIEIQIFCQYLNLTCAYYLPKLLVRYICLNIFIFTSFFDSFARTDSFTLFLKQKKMCIHLNSNLSISKSNNSSLILPQVFSCPI